MAPQANAGMGPQGTPMPPGPPGPPPGPPGPPLAAPRPGGQQPPTAPPGQRPGNGQPGTAQRDVRVNWRGIVDSSNDPDADGDAPKRDRLRFVKRGARRVLEVAGIWRKVNPDGTYAPRPWKRMIIVYGGAVVIFLIITMGHIVPAGSVSVPLQFGKAGEAFTPGFHVTAPWPIVQMQDMSTQTQNYTMSAKSSDGAVKGQDDSVSVLGKDGAGANIDATVLYRVDPNRATLVYNQTGLDYTTKIIRPGARACIRTEFTNYDLVDAATDAWGKVSDDITKCMKDKTDAAGLTLMDFQLREVSLSPQVQNSVDAKVASQQDAERQQFEIQTAEKQADIQRVKAKAAADSQQIVACGGTETQAKDDSGTTVEQVTPNPVTNCTQAQLTPQFLQYTYIQALQGLVNSPNNSTVILPFDQNLTPLLNLPGSGGSGQKQAQVVTPSPTTTPPAQSQSPTGSPTPSTP
jgi:regulator of protease activity HflC (stomatin/prohibitin superfamily)